MVKVNGINKDYCFAYNVFIKTEMKISYSVASEHEEKFDVKVTNNNSTELYFKHHMKKEQGRVNQKQEGRTEFTIDKGRVELCFIPLEEKKQYLISFDMIISFSNEKIANLGTDEGMKNVLKEVKEIKGVIDELEVSLKHTADGKFNHLRVLGNILNSIKILSYLKIGMYLVFSVIQAFIIIKFFGPDKRVSKIMGAYSDGL